MSGLTTKAIYLTALSSIRTRNILAHL